MLPLDVEQHVLYQIANAEVRSYPFPHFYICPIFPPDFYAEFLAKLPGIGTYKRLDETGTVPKGTYTQRYVCRMEDLEEDEFQSGAGTFWAKLNTWMLSDIFAAALMQLFSPGIAERFGADAKLDVVSEGRLVRDLTKYALTPHTDTPRKLISLLFYLPADDSMKHLGTSLHVPRDPSFRCEGTAHHPEENFKKVATMQYLPNALFGFLKSNRAFHGVDEIQDEQVVRDSLMYNLYVDKVATANPESGASRSGFSLPWRK